MKLLIEYFSDIKHIGELVKDVRFIELLKKIENGK
jgi:hypothetical protein